MKIIHCADIHLDSPLSGVADGKKRRQELFEALARLFSYAENVAASAVIIAGDLFDGRATNATVKNVADLFNGCGRTVFLLRGNHGEGDSYEMLKKRTGENVLYFGDDWTGYDLGGVAVYGAERPTAQNTAQLRLDREKFNILVLHGDVDSDAYGAIDKKAIADTGADYCALGHRHAFREFRWKGTVAAYSGALECRGFDENVRTGFVLVDTAEKTFKFVPQSLRRVENVTVDVSDCHSEAALFSKTEKALAETDGKNYLDLTFCGALQSDVSLARVREGLEGRFFALRTEDKTHMALDVSAIAKERSLRGEFVRSALEISDEEMRRAVLRLGLSTLSGGEAEL